MQGREKILKKIRKRFIFGIVMGVLLCLVGAFLLLCFIVSEERTVGPYVLAAFPLIFGAFFLIWGSWCIANPMKTPQLKTNPRLLEQADELFANIRYEDKLIIMSDRVIASKRDLTQMVYFEEVLKIYENIHTTNMITDTHTLNLETATYTALINVYGCKDQVVESLKDKIYSMCPNILPYNM